MTGLASSTGIAELGALFLQSVPTIPPAVPVEPAAPLFGNLLALLFEEPSPDVPVEWDEPDACIEVPSNSGEARELAPLPAAPPPQIAAALIRSMLVAVPREVRIEEVAVEERPKIRETAATDVDDVLPLPEIEAPESPERAEEPEAETAVLAASETAVLAAPETAGPEPLVTVPAPPPQTVPKADAAPVPNRQERVSEAPDAPRKHLPNPAMPAEPAVVRERLPEAPIAFTMRLTPETLAPQASAVARPAPLPAARIEPAPLEKKMEIEIAEHSPVVTEPHPDSEPKSEPGSNFSQEDGPESKEFANDPPEKPEARPKPRAVEPILEKNTAAPEPAKPLQAPMAVNPPARAAEPIFRAPIQENPSPARVEPPLPPAEIRPAAAKELAVRISAPDAAPVDLRIAERGGEVRVAVRTENPALQTSLRQELPALVERLENTGFRAEAAIPSESSASHIEPLAAPIERTGEAPFLRQTASGASGEQSSESGQQPDTQDPQQQRRRQQPRDRWQEVLEDTE